jgi:hypothetical protein
MVNECCAASHQTLLAIAHPGHELRAYGWLEKHCPAVLILTDGSGHQTEGRFLRTVSILKSLQVDCCNWFNPYADRQIYQFILRGNGQFFLDLKAQLVDVLVQSPAIDFVLGDEYEGYNCVHDLFALVVHAAVCEVRSQRSIQHYVFPTVGHPNQCPDALLTQAIVVPLAPDRFERKIQVALSYSELRAEVKRAIEQHSIQVFQTEYFYPFQADHPKFQTFVTHKPHYELYGEQQVEKGYYQDVIRFQQHIYPIQQQLIASFH